MKSKINPNEGRNINMRSSGTMNFSCLYFYPRCPRHNLGRQACSFHFEGFQTGQSPIFGRLPDFCVIFGQVVHIFRGDPVRAILGVIQILYLNNNMSLISSLLTKCVRKRILKNYFLGGYEFSVA